HGRRLLFAGRPAALNTMNHSLDELTAHVLNRLRLVQQTLGVEADEKDANTRFADLIDSMGLVELVAVLAADCGGPPAAVGDCVQRNFSTIGGLAQAMSAAGIVPRCEVEPASLTEPQTTPAERTTLGTGCWLVATAVRLPATVQPAEAVDEALGRPRGWFEGHAGIQQRRIWGSEDPVQAAADTARSSLVRAGLELADVGALLVTSEAPPMLAGLAAAIHYRLSLKANVPALEI